MKKMHHFLLHVCKYTDSLFPFHMPIFKEFHYPKICCCIERIQEYKEQLILLQYM
jgi:hypothetical protein